MATDFALFLSSAECLHLSVTTWRGLTGKSYLLWSSLQSNVQLGNLGSWYSCGCHWTLPAPQHDNAHCDIAETNQELPKERYKELKESTWPPDCQRPRASVECARTSLIHEGSTLHPTGFAATVLVPETTGHPRRSCDPQLGLNGSDLFGISCGSLIRWKLGKLEAILMP